MRIAVCGLVIACASLVWPQIQVTEFESGQQGTELMAVSHDGSIALLSDKLYHRNGTVTTLPTILLGRSVTPFQISGNGNCVLYSAGAAGIIHYNRTTGVATLAPSAGTGYSPAGISHDGSLVYLTNNVGYFKWTLNSPSFFALLNFPAGVDGVGGQTSLLGTSSIFVTRQSGQFPEYRVWKYTPAQGAILLPDPMLVYKIHWREANVSADGGVYAYWSYNPDSIPLIHNRFSTDAPNLTNPNSIGPIQYLTFNGNAAASSIPGAFWRRDIGLVDSVSFIQTFYATRALTDLQEQKLRAARDAGITAISADATTFWGVGESEAPGNSIFCIYNPLTFRKQIGERYRISARYTTRSSAQAPLETDDSSTNLLEVYYDLNSPLLSPTSQSTLNITNMKPQTSLSFSGQPGFVWTFGAQTSVPFSYHIKDADPTGPIDTLMGGTVNITLGDLRSGSRLISSSDGTLLLTFTLLGPVHDPNT